MAKARRPHIRRETLPWCTHTPETRTECGRAPDPDWPTMSRAEWQTIREEWDALTLSYRRAGMRIGSGVVRPDVCLACWSTAVRHPTWERDPILSLRRYLEDFGSSWQWNRDPVSVSERDRVRRELWALARLAGVHGRQFTAAAEQFRGGFRRPDSYAAEWCDR
jgi:hypothetical protein